MSSVNPTSSSSTLSKQRYRIELLADIVGRVADDPFELVVMGVERAGAARLDTSFLERLRRLVRTPVLSIVGNAEPQPRPSRDPVDQLRELFEPRALVDASSVH